MPIPVAVLAALAAGGTAAIGSGFSAGQSGRNTKRTIQANKELAQYAYARDQEMWHQANVYNSPEMQMKRLEAAGLNKHLVYGSGNVAGNSSTQTPKYNPPNVNYDQPSIAGEMIGTLPDSISRYQDMAMRQAQIDNVQASTKKINTQSAVEALTLEYMGYDRPYQVEKGRVGEYRAFQEYERLLRQNTLDESRSILAGYQTESVKMDLPIKAKEALMRDIQIEIANKTKHWKKAGVSESDQLWLKSLMSVAQQLGLDTEAITKMINDTMAELWK